MSFRLHNIHATNLLLIRMATLTIFTSTYNRAHTIGRTYESLCRQTCKDFNWLIIDDGSNDGTKDWVESLGSGTWIRGTEYDWMGRKISDNVANACFMVDVPTYNGMLHIDYIYKPNGGLYTGYNVAYDFIQTELCVCIDSDDFAPNDAVEKIKKLWMERGSEKYCGIEGLDFDIKTMQPIGGYFPKKLKEVYLHDLSLKKIHLGDTKQVMRTELMRAVAPQVGFEGEKNFNPIYMLLQVCDKYPLLVINDNLCIVEYQIGTDSMSQGIYKQYMNSPRSFAKMRLQEMRLAHNTLKDKFRSAIHYVSSCIIAHDQNWLRKSTRKDLTLLAFPLGLMLAYYIKYKARKKSWI